VVPIVKPDAVNFIFGQSHFIKTVEDLHEALVGAVPGIRFGLAFCEASGKRLVRWSGNDEAALALARDNALAIGAGHTFLIFLGDGFFPVNVLAAVRAVPEVCRIYCATANPTQVIVAQTELGRGVLGVVDGASPLGIETDADIAWRKDLLRKIGEPNAINSIARRLGRYLPESGLVVLPLSFVEFDPKPKSDLPIGIYLYPGSCASTAPAELARTAGAVHSGGANVAVAQVRGLLRSLCVLVLERREAVLGKGGHPGVIGRLQLDLVKPGGVAREDQLLGCAVGVAERRKAVLLLHVLRDFEPAQRLDLPLR
jgi:hypothetical protein